MNNFYQQIAALSPEQRIIFEKRLKQKELNQLQKPETSKIKITRRKNSKDLPLSFAQQRLWFFQQLNPESSAYNVFNALHIEGQLNIAVLEKVFTEIVSRHENLRTTFTTDSEGQPIQVISSSHPLIIPIVDLKDVPNRKEEVQILATREIQKPFDLTKPLLRLTLVQLGDAEHVLLITIHHIICDRWSLGIFIREMKVLYEAFFNGQPSLLPELSIQYADWSVWQQEYLQGEVLLNQTNYWKKQLANLSVLELPTDRPRPAIATYKGAKQSFELSKTLSDTLKALSVNEGITLFTLLLTVFKVLLHKYTNQNDIVVGTDIVNRSRSETEELIGFLINTLVLRSDLSGNPTFRQLLNRVREVTLKAYDHQDLPFDKLVDILNPERNLSEMIPLFQVKFDLQLAQVEALELSNLTVSYLNFDNGTTKFELRFNFLETDQGLIGLVEYSTDIFDASTINRMVEHYRNLLERIVTNPQQQLCELSLLTESERHQLLVEWNNTAVDYPQQQCIYQLFEAQVERTPDAVAVVFEDEQLTYWELNIRANQLAHYLRSLGVKPEVLVGIYVERSLFMVIGLLAILKAGGAYVPLDPSYPQKRLAFILENTQAPVLLTQASLMEAMPQHKAQVVCLDAHWHYIAQQSKENFFCGLTPDNLAYVIYTSGSTGKPKGVMIKHSSTVAMLDWSNKTFEVEARGGVLASTSICFDLSVFEIFVPLSCGGKVLLIENALYLPTLPTTESVTLINTVPSVISQLLRTDGIPTSVQTVNIAGEPLHNQLVQQLYQQENIQQVFNLYGPSEDTTYSTSTCIQKGTSNTPPIGRPIHNTQIYLLDKNYQPVPVCVPGMLYIGGAGLARGYFNQPELTADKFIPNPYTNQPGETRISHKQ
ncbi:amino acid adenylation domain-containing protein [uncultured Nostoc sp.]|uniref:non-ribosomal peptide synthetase n=1 Tax=uncultured Nostoc sp. TaxID=340711 RepID=UPI0035CAEDB1